MPTRLPGTITRRTLAIAGAVLWTASQTAGAQARQIAYTIRMPAPASHTANVEARFPTAGADSVDLMMAVWSPGYYVQENYAARVKDISATAANGAALSIEQPQPNRWRIHTNKAAAVLLTYSLQADRRSVTGNWVGADYAVLNGAPTFITFVDTTRRVHDVTIELPPEWKQTATSLTAAPDGNPNHYRAQSYDELVDSPIVAGNISMHQFNVAGTTHILADIGDVPAKWDGELAARNLQKFVRANHTFWGSLPFKKYVFLNVFRRGGGGLEHLNSTLLTSSLTSAGGGDINWLQYVSHEYFHAHNVKRLRPVELGPFDYEHPPQTPSLWIAEGLTTYYGDVLASRGGLGSADDVLGSLSSDITSLQNSPGRLRQTLAQSSLGIFSSSGTSGVGVDTTAGISYYVKGHIVGFLLDARIQRATQGQKSLDDVMRLAYARYGGARGYTPDEFVAVASEVAGRNLKPFFHRMVETTEELEYDDALQWYGLRFAPARDPAKAWTL
jgi:predicted metalloprotease with PDZ domain